MVKDDFELDLGGIVRDAAPEDAVTDADQLIDTGGAYPAVVQAAWWETNKYEKKQANILFRPISMNPEQFDGFIMKRLGDGSLVTNVEEGEEFEEVKTHSNILFADYNNKTFSKYGFLMRMAQTFDTSIDRSADDFLEELPGHYFVVERRNLLRGDEDAPDPESPGFQEEFMNRLLTFSMEKICTQCQETFEPNDKDCSSCDAPRGRIPRPVHMIVDSIENWEGEIGKYSSWADYAKQNKIVRVPVSEDIETAPKTSKKAPKKPAPKKPKAGSVESKQDVFIATTNAGITALARGEGDWSLDEAAELGEKAALDEEDVVRIATEQGKVVISAEVANGGLDVEGLFRVWDGMGLREDGKWRGDTKKDRGASEKRHKSILKELKLEIDDEDQVVAVEA